MAQLTLESVNEALRGALKEGVKMSEVVQAEMGFVSEMMQEKLENLDKKIREDKVLWNRLEGDMTELENMSHNMMRLTQMYDAELEKEGSDKERLWREKT